MTADDQLTLVSSIVFLALAMLSAIRARREPVALALGALYTNLFAYHVLDLIARNAGNVGPAAWLESAAASLAVPVAFSVVVTFVGQRKRRSALTRVLYIYFAGLALGCVAPFVVPSAAFFPLGAAWAILVAIGLVFTLAMAVSILVVHARSAGEDERPGAYLVLSALVLGVGGSGTDVFAIAGAPVPRLAAWGLLAAGVLLAAGTTRFGIVRGLTLRSMLTSFGIALAGIVVQLALVRVWSTNGALLVVSSVAVTLVVWIGLRYVIGQTAQRTERLRYHATLGRLAAQMAHDVRNPLAAVRGSAEFLLEERAQGRSMDAHASYVELILQQSDRILEVVSDYQRLGRASAQRRTVALSDLIEELVAAQRVALGEGTTITLALDPSRSPVFADPSLVAQALENLLRNADEAMPDGGTIRVSSSARGAYVIVRVEDNGQGMDAVTRESALDDFFTTKASGSGLGLSFVRRVAEAHGTSVRITSAVGKGTSVELSLPVPGGDAAPRSSEPSLD